MQREIPIGLLAAHPSLKYVFVSMEYRRVAGKGAELLLWLDVAISPLYIQAGQFWCEWFIGEPCWVRFAHDFSAFNLAAFAAVEVLPARGPVQPPPGALWLLSDRPDLPVAATP